MILNNEDLDITHASHKYYKKGSIIQHLQSTKTFPITFAANKVTFSLNGITYEMPRTEALKVLNTVNRNIPDVDLSLGAY